MVTTIPFALTAALFIAGSAEAQRLAPPPDPALSAATPTALASVPSFPRLVAINEGLAPADPLAPDLYRYDPKFYARVDFGSRFGIETTLTNPGYVADRIRYLGPGPRVAQGTPLAAGGYNLDVAGRLTAPVDSQLTAFGTLGVSATAKDTHWGTIIENGASASIGATYKLSSSQTATLEVPLGANERKAMSGSATGVGARIKLGF